MQLLSVFNNKKTLREFFYLTTRWLPIFTFRIMSLHMLSHHNSVVRAWTYAKNSVYTIKIWKF